MMTSVPFPEALEKASRLRCWEVLGLLAGCEAVQFAPERPRRVFADI